MLRGLMTVSTNAKSIHPGETVLVTGTHASNGSVTARSVTVGAQGASLGAGALGAGAATGSGGSGGSGATGSGSGATPQLFGSGG